MFTKIKENGKLQLFKSIKFNLGFSTGRKPIRGSAMKTLHGKPRRAYNLANKF